MTKNYRQGQILKLIRTKKISTQDIKIWSAS